MSRMRTCVPLPTPKQLRTQFSPSVEAYKWIEKKREEICSILSDKDNRTLLVIGPCSVHSSYGTMMYAKQFTELASQVKEQFLLVMRVYYEKPRTSCGWKGMLHDPYRNGSFSLAEGLVRVRKLLSSLAEMRVPIAVELLSPLALPYFEDLLTWGCIGARTCESQTHRELASSAPFPVGIKNSTSGALLPAIHALVAASQQHSLFTLDDEGRSCYTQSSGNSSTMLVLRGSSNGPNYDSQTIQQAQQLLRAHNLSPHVLVDCSHGNSGKDPERQAAVFNTTLKQIAEGNNDIKGIMLESYLEAGAEEREPTSLLQSVTDPCLDWESTKNLILQAQLSLTSTKKELLCV
jgi:3-deoxy-7-phosphoheptulonate synthase